MTTNTLTPLTKTAISGTIEMEDPMDIFDFEVKLRGGHPLNPSFGIVLTSDEFGGTENIHYGEDMYAPVWLDSSVNHASYNYSKDIGTCISPVFLADDTSRFAGYSDRHPMLGMAGPEGYPRRDEYIGTKEWAEDFAKELAASSFHNGRYVGEIVYLLKDGTFSNRVYTESQMTDTRNVIILDNEKRYDVNMPVYVTESETFISNWLEYWLEDYIYATDNPDQHTAVVKLQVIDTATRDVLYVGGFEVNTTQA